METIDTITTVMMEEMCDNICKFPVECKDADELEEHCSNCPMSPYIRELMKFDTSKK